MSNCYESFVYNGLCENTPPNNCPVFLSRVFYSRKVVSAISHDFTMQARMSKGILHFFILDCRKSQNWDARGAG